MNRLVVGVADCQTTGDPDTVLLTYALGSCIGLTVYDPVVRVGGLLHFMLPDSALDHTRSRANPFLFADTGIPLLLEKVYALGASRLRLIAGAVGAARILDEQRVFDIGSRNYQATRRLLSKHGLGLQSEAVGGTDFRTIGLEIATGRLLLQEAGRHRELATGWPKKGEQPLLITF